MAYKIKKSTPSNTNGYPIMSCTNYNNARQALKDILANYKNSYDALLQPGDADYQDQEAYLHNNGDNLVAFNGGDRIEYSIYEVN